MKDENCSLVIIRFTEIAMSSNWQVFTLKTEIVNISDPLSTRKHSSMEQDCNGKIKYKPIKSDKGLVVDEQTAIAEAVCSCK